MSMQQSFWQRFSDTGEIDAYLMYKQIGEEQDGEYKNKRDSDTSAGLWGSRPDADNFH